jgi:hypothetical protein
LQRKNGGELQDRVRDAVKSWAISL